MTFAPRLFLLASALLAFVLLGACSLPLNSALREWSRMASLSLDRPDLAESSSQRAMQQALSSYFYALGVLWDGAPLTFRAETFTPLVAQAGQPASGAIAKLSTALASASADTPPRWVTAESFSPRPAYEDRRLANLIRAGDAPVRLLLTELGRGAPLPYASLVAQIGEGQASLLARAETLTQRATEREMLLAKDGLARQVLRMPPAPFTPQSPALAAVLAP